MRLQIGYKVNLAIKSYDFKNFWIGAGDSQNILPLNQLVARIAY